MHQHDVDENAFLVIFAIAITIAMLPFINKLKMGNVEIEVESSRISSTWTHFYILRSFYV